MSVWSEIKKCFRPKAAVAQSLWANRRPLVMNEETMEYDRRIADAYACWRKTSDMIYLHQAKYLECVRNEIQRSLEQR